MYYCPLLSSVLCPVHRQLILLVDLPAHIKLHHKFVMRMIGRILPSLIGHIGRTFKISSMTTPRGLFEKLSTVRLSSPVPGLSDPELCIQCPICTQWFKSDHQRPYQCIRAHWNSNRSYNSRCQTWYKTLSGKPVPSLPRHYASTLFNPLDSRFTPLRVVFTTGYLPAHVTPSNTTSAERPTESSNIESPQYLDNFGWIPYLDSLNAEPSDLLQLIAIPSNRMVAQWPEESEGFCVEEGLIVLHKFFRLYLKDANTRVNSCHGTVRDALVEGY
jgi:hypothetical protein